jgi:hypothetical protein
MNLILAAISTLFIAIWEFVLLPNGRRTMLFILSFVFLLGIHQCSSPAYQELVEVEGAARQVVSGWAATFWECSQGECPSDQPQAEIFGKKEGGWSWWWRPIGMIFFLVMLVSFASHVIFPPIYNKLMGWWVWVGWQYRKSRMDVKDEDFQKVLESMPAGGFAGKVKAFLKNPSIITILSILGLEALGDLGVHKLLGYFKKDKTE